MLNVFEQLLRKLQMAVASVAHAWTAAAPSTVEAESLPPLSLVLVSPPPASAGAAPLDELLEQNVSPIASVVVATTPTTSRKPPDFDLRMTSLSVCKRSVSVASGSAGGRFNRSSPRRIQGSSKA
jgi:hypothetical protein